MFSVQAIAIGRRKILFFAIILALLSSCYVPVRFDAEIKVTRRGYYTMIYDGYLVDIGLYNDLRQNKITADKEVEKVDLIRTDLIGRDPSVKDFKYFNKGHFKVNWERKGDLLDAKMVTFLRRNEKFLTLKYIKEKGLAVMEGASISEVTAKQLADVGLGIEGEIRVITDLPVVDHNAAKVKGDVKGFGEKTFIWKIKNFRDPVPKLVMVLK